MRTLVHLSDLHFGRVDHALIDPLIEFVSQIKPDVVVVSGDLTQRARVAQFQEARLFLDRLPSPQIVIPGNHDVPLYNIFGRFLHPLRNFCRIITDDLEPFYADDEIAIVGINTVRLLTIKRGRINQDQIAGVHAKLSSVSAAVTKFIVTHHPFDIPAGYGDKDLVKRARIAMKSFAECGADILLAGHLHVSHTESTAERYEISGYSALVVQAGTATSTRGRGETNSFNIVRVDGRCITIERCTWQPDEKIFMVSATKQFHRVGYEWLHRGP